MARQIGAVCRLCRKEGMKLFLKGSRCMSDKCAFIKRDYKPGQHGQSRGRPRKVSNYGMQLREKQKVKRIYGILEKQFRSYFQKAEKQKGITGETLLQILERRLDNVIFKSCFAASRSEARQMVKHGFFTVNGEKVDIPSYLIKADDLVKVNAKEKTQKLITQSIEENKDRGIPEWMNLDETGQSITIVRLPGREDVGFPVQEQLIVELYSK